ncbi:MAG: acetate--CoA ligase family protein [Deltaproteobacteria bacterium]|nr:acetate--CoA ligase family protein [Deltaproteobacteria bacterium]
MEFFFKPRGIALVGATAKKGKGGHSLLINLARGFKGPIYPINPGYSEIDGLKCYPSIADIPDPIDIAVIFVPAGKVPGIMSECAARGIPGVIIESAGFAETGDRGRHLEQEMMEIARKSGIRIWGPNCMGLIDAKNRYVFSFCTPIIWDVGLYPGDVSLIVQSGMLSANFLIDGISHGTMNISKVCSIGNKLDVDESDILAYLIDDPDTKAVGLYLESIQNVHRFMELCRRSNKPIVVLKGGKSPQGARAAMSHTASMAGSGAIVSSALAQAGVIEAYDFKQMMDICRALAMFPDLSDHLQNRFAVLTFSGAAGIISSDFIHKAGLEIADFSPETHEKIGSVFPSWMPVANPVDMWPAIELHGPRKVYETCVAAAAADPNVDAIFFHSFVGSATSLKNFSKIVSYAPRAGKPIFCWLLGLREEAARAHSNIQDLGVPVYRELARAVEAMEAVFAYRKIRQRRQKVEKDIFPALPPLPDLQHEFIDTESVFDEYRSKQILSKCGINVVRDQILPSLDEALKIGRDWGFPLVLKGILPGEIHKTEQGLVHLGITTETALKHAFEDLRQLLPAAGRILIQPQIPGQLELIAGYIRDPQFGPCVMLGLGGVMAEVLDDKAFVVAPVSNVDAAHLIDRLKSRKLLNGFRGAAPVDRGALSRIIIRLGQIGEYFPRIRSIDINPLMINNGNPIAVDASIILGE